MMGVIIRPCQNFMGTKTNPLTAIIAVGISPATDSASSSHSGVRVRYTDGSHSVSYCQRRHFQQSDVIYMSIVVVTFVNNDFSGCSDLGCWGMWIPVDGACDNGVGAGRIVWWAGKEKKPFNRCFRDQDGVPSENKYKTFGCRHQCLIETNGESYQKYCGGNYFSLSLIPASGEWVLNF